MFLFSGIGTQAWPASYRLRPIHLVFGYVRSRNVWRCLGWCEALWCVCGGHGSANVWWEVEMRRERYWRVPSCSVYQCTSPIQNFCPQYHSSSRIPGVIALQNFRESSTLTPCQLKILSRAYLLPPDRRIPCLFQLWKLGSLFNSRTTVLQEVSCHGGSKSEACW